MVRGTRILVDRASQNYRVNKNNEISTIVSEARWRNPIENRVLK